MRALPTGTVTFVFTDIEGSTRLLRELGAEAYADALAEHRRLLREVFDRHEGPEFEHGRESGRRLSLDEIVQLTLAKP
jgi:class 3 adenylate cyclase